MTSEKSSNAPSCSIPDGVSVLSEDDIRQSLAEFVHKKIFYRKKPLKKLAITNTESSASYKYYLDTYQEKRSTRWQSEPYCEQYVDGPCNGLEPEPFDIQVDIAIWYDCKEYYKVPHTSQVHFCGRCSGSGHTRETSSNSNESTKTVTCSSCDGHGRIMKYKQLIVKRKTHRKEFTVVNIAHSTIPSKKLMSKKTKGTLIFRQETDRVHGLDIDSEKPEFQYLAEQSKKVVKEQREELTEGLTLKQRNGVTIIPVTQVRCEYKNNAKIFYVYGLNNKIYFPNYYGNLRFWQ